MVCLPTNLSQVVGYVVRRDLLEERRSVDAYRTRALGGDSAEAHARNNVVRSVGLGKQQRCRDAAWRPGKSRLVEATMFVTKIPWPKIASLIIVGVMVLVQFSAML